MSREAPKDLLLDEVPQKSIFWLITRFFEPHEVPSAKLMADELREAPRIL